MTANGRATSASADAAPHEAATRFSQQSPSPPTAPPQYDRRPPRLSGSNIADRDQRLPTKRATIRVSTPRAARLIVGGGFCRVAIFRANAWRHGLQTDGKASRAAHSR
ncbi:MAG: hypothetical protein ACLUEQ_02190 [Cloacibacillus evryensis]